MAGITSGPFGSPISKLGVDCLAVILVFNVAWGLCSSHRPTPEQWESDQSVVVYSCYELHGLGLGGGSPLGSGAESVTVMNWDSMGCE